MSRFHGILIVALLVLTGTGVSNAGALNALKNAMLSSFTHIQNVLTPSFIAAGLAGADGSVDYDAWADLTSDMVLDYQTLNTTVTMCSCYYTGIHMHRVHTYS